MRNAEMIQAQDSDYDRKLMSMYGRDSAMGNSMNGNLLVEDNYYDADDAGPIGLVDDGFTGTPGTQRSSEFDYEDDKKETGNYYYR